jgi:hypothetical protein
MLFLIILLLSFGVTMIGSWWTIAIVAFIVAIFFGKNYSQAFWSGFLAIFFLWLFLALFKSIPNSNVLAARVAKMFQLPHWSFILLITALIGGFIGGLSAACGYRLRAIFSTKNPQ